MVGFRIANRTSFLTPLTPGSFYILTQVTESTMPDAPDPEYASAVHAQRVVRGFLGRLAGQKNMQTVPASS